VTIGLFIFWYASEDKEMCYRAETVGVVKMELDVMDDCELIHRVHNTYLITCSIYDKC